MPQLQFPHLENGANETGAEVPGGQQEGDTVISVKLLSARSGWGTQVE